MIPNARHLVLGMLLCLISCVEAPKEKPFELQSVDNSAGRGSALPYLFANDEHILLSWVEPAGDSLMALKYSLWEEDQWTKPQEVLRASDWFVNWADFPSIAENKGNLLMHVLKKSSEGTYSYDVKLNLKEDRGTTWKTNLPLHTDNTPTEHGFVTSLPYKEGFFVTWLDGRNTLENEKGERGAMTIRAAEVNKQGTINNELELDARTCDCCQTTAAITDNGPVVIYRDRSDDEIRDISIVRREAGQWSVPKSIHADNWKIKGCPVNGPKAAVLGNNLVIAWFTAAGDKPMVNLVFSGDGGKNFDKPIRVDEANAMGRVDVLLSDNDSALVSWMEASEGQALVKAVRINRDGNKGEVRKITELDPSRKTGFPQMEALGDSIYFAWTDFVEENTRIRTAIVSKEYF